MPNEARVRGNAVILFFAVLNIVHNPLSVNCCVCISTQTLYLKNIATKHLKYPVKQLLMIYVSVSTALSARTVIFLMVSPLPDENLDIDFLSVLGNHLLWSVFVKLSCNKVKLTLFMNFRQFG